MFARRPNFTAARNASHRHEAYHSSAGSTSIGGRHSLLREILTTHELSELGLDNAVRPTDSQPTKRMSVKQFSRIRDSLIYLALLRALALGAILYSHARWWVHSSIAPTLTAVGFSVLAFTSVETFFVCLCLGWPHFRDHSCMAAWPGHAAAATGFSLATAMLDGAFVIELYLNDRQRLFWVAAFVWVFSEVVAKGVIMIPTAISCYSAHLFCNLEVISGRSWYSSHTRVSKEAGYSPSLWEILTFRSDTFMNILRRSAVAAAGNSVVRTHDIPITKGDIASYGRLAAGSGKPSDFESHSPEPWRLRGVSIALVSWQYLLLRVVLRVRIMLRRLGYILSFCVAAIKPRPIRALLYGRGNNSRSAAGSALLDPGAETDCSIRRLQGIVNERHDAVSATGDLLTAGDWGSSAACNLTAHVRIAPDSATGDQTVPAVSVAPALAHGSPMAKNDDGTRLMRFLIPSTDSASDPCLGTRAPFGDLQDSSCLLSNVRRSRTEADLSQPSQETMVSSHKEVEMGIISRDHFKSNQAEASVDPFPEGTAVIYRLRRSAEPTPEGMPVANIAAVRRSCGIVPGRPGFEEVAEQLGNDGDLPSVPDSPIPHISLQTAALASHDETASWSHHCYRHQSMMWEPPAPPEPYEWQQIELRPANDDSICAVFDELTVLTAPPDQKVQEATWLSLLVDCYSIHESLREVLLAPDLHEECDFFFALMIFFRLHITALALNLLKFHQLVVAPATSVITLVGLVLSLVASLHLFIYGSFEQQIVQDILDED